MVSLPRPREHSEPPTAPTQPDGQAPPFDDVLTGEEAARFLKLSYQHIRRLAEIGELPGRRLGDRWRFSRPALLRYLEGENPPKDAPTAT